jgi:UPF0755 protein
MEMLVNHEAIQHRITVAEGLTSAMAAEIIRNDPVLLGALTETAPEGSLLPETYLFERGTTRNERLGHMRRAQEELLSELWPNLETHQ